MAEFFGRLVVELVGGAISLWISALEDKHGMVAVRLSGIVLTGIIGIIVGIATQRTKTALVFAAIGVMGAALTWYASRRYRGLI